LKAFGVWWSVHSKAREIVGEWEVFCPTLNVLGTSDREEEEEKVVGAVSAFPSPGVALATDSLEQRSPAFPFPWLCSFRDWALANCFPQILHTCSFPE